MKLPFLPSLRTRSSLSERMDAPDCDEPLLLRTVAQFASINRLVSRYRTLLSRWVLADMLREPDRQWHLVDMGAGGCDIDVWLLAQARRHGLKLRITACDLDDRIVRAARANWENEPGLSISKLDVLNDAVEAPVDFVFANHFLHHLSSDQIQVLIQKWVPQVRHRLIFSDLKRSALSYLGYAVLALIYRNSFAREDGLISIQRGFRAQELRELAIRSNVPESAIRVDTLALGRLALLIEPTA
jgi:2-polyprenyl-3-methyl-5-hydroxy-6-metoxy-1,4-benzoquinol methylase